MERELACEKVGNRIGVLQGVKIKNDACSFMLFQRLQGLIKSMYIC
jgi:hypothetical protein